MGTFQPGELSWSQGLDPGPPGTIGLKDLQLPPGTIGLKDLDDLILVLPSSELSHLYSAHLNRN